MIKITDLMREMTADSKFISEDEVPTPSVNSPDTPTDTTQAAPSFNTKALLLGIHKQSGDLYNMTGEDDAPEAWVEDAIKASAEELSKAYNHTNYEKNKPVTVGDGETSPAEPEINEEADKVDPDKQKQLSAKDNWVRANQQAKSAKGDEKVSAKQRALSLKQTYLDAQKAAVRKQAAE